MGFQPWVAELKARGFPVKPLEDGQRIVPFATSEKMVINADGTLAPLIEGSTKQVTLVNHSAGIRKTQRFSFPAS